MDNSLIALSASALVLGAVAFLWYGHGIRRKEIQPRFASWIIFAVGSTLTFGAYVADHIRDPRLDYMGNAANHLGIVLNWGVVAAILTWGIREPFKRFEVLCLKAAAVISLVWITTRIVDLGTAEVSDIVASIAFNTLMVTGYLPTCQTIFGTKKNVESFSWWGGSLIVNAALLYPAKGLGLIYAWRAFLSIAFLVGLMTYFQFFYRRKKS